VFENHGALFDQTIYQAKNDNQNVTGKMALLPAKQNRPTSIYGGHSGQNIAYLVIVLVFDKEDYLKVMGVPIRLVSKIKEARAKSDEAEKAFLKDFYAPEFVKGKSKKAIDFEILKPHVPLLQPIRDMVAGQKHTFALGTNTYYRNLQQLILPMADQQVLLGNSDDEQADKALVEVYDHICEQVMGYFPLYDRNRFRQSLVENRNNFLDLPVKNSLDEKGKINGVGKREILNRLMIGLHANPTVGNLDAIGKKTPLGKLQIKGGIQLTKSAEIIFESPTGLFQRKIKVTRIIK